MLTPLNEEEGQVASQRRGRVGCCEDGAGQPHVPVVLAAVGEGPGPAACHPAHPEPA